MDNRLYDRTKRRLPCDLRCEERRHSGVVLDLSPTGLFLQTSAKLTTGAQVELGLKLPTQPEPVRLVATVVRRKVVPPSLTNVAQGGVGLQIVRAPESYYAFLERLWAERTEISASPVRAPRSASTGSEAAAAPQTASAPQTAPAPLQRHRVRLKQIGGSRSRLLVVDASSSEEAEQKALAELGEGWKVLEIETASG